VDVQPVAEDLTFRVGTLNLRNTSDRWTERKPMLLEQLSALEPDIIGLQELRRPSLQGRHILAAANSGSARFTLQTVFKTGLRWLWEGEAVLTELPVLENERIDLRGDNRVAQRVRVVLPNGERLDFYNTHLAHHAERQDLRFRQAEIILESMSRANDIPKILVGDLNATPDEPAILLIASALRSAYSAVHGTEPPRTVPSPLSRTWGKEEKVIDYIFVDDRVEVHDAWVTFDTPSTDDPRLTASDHYGLAAKVSIR
jgi:endonuclease/exonuclease/phosphatase family metal-dependent hydrolase